MEKLKIETQRGTILDGVLFGTNGRADTVMIAITGIHGNFYSNPFYYNISNTGALLIGTYDRFTDGDPTGFLRNINSHIPTAAQNRLVFIEQTGHTYQQKEQEVADKILELIKDWKNE